MNMAPTIRLLLASAALLLLLASCVHAHPELNVLTVTGTDPSTVTIGVGDLTGGAGSALVTAKENTAGDLVMSVWDDDDGHNLGKSTWRVVVKRSVSANWPAALAVAVKRTGDGISIPTGHEIEGGESYRTITGTDAEFFVSSFVRTGVPLRFRLAGISLAVPPDTYTATITFTMIDTF